MWLFKVREQKENRPSAEVRLSSLLLKAQTAQNRGDLELTVMLFVGTCCFLLMYRLFIHFQFALPSVTSNKCPPQAPVSTSKSCRETWEPSSGVKARPRSADLKTAFRGRSMVDVLHAKHFPSCPVCSVWAEPARQHHQTSWINIHRHQSWYYRPTADLYRKQNQSYSSGWGSADTWQEPLKEQFTQNVKTQSPSPPSMLMWSQFFFFFYMVSHIEKKN